MPSYPAAAGRLPSLSWDTPRCIRYRLLAIGYWLLDTACGDSLYQIWQRSRTDGLHQVRVAAGGHGFFFAIFFRVKRNREYWNLSGAGIGSQAANQGQSIVIRERQIDNDNLGLFPVD